MEWKYVLVLLLSIISFFSLLSILLTIGLSNLKVRTKIQPNQGIWISGKNAIFLSLITSLIVMLILGFIGLLIILYYDTDKLPIVLFILILGGFLVLPIGLTAGMMKGGGKACVRHLVLRLILYGKGYTPWNYARFLDHAAERLFLQKVGGGYIFVHRVLMEHFAKMELEQEHDR